MLYKIKTIHLIRCVQYISCLVHFLLADLVFHIVHLCIHAACALIAANSHHATPTSHANANPSARRIAANWSPYAACGAARHPSHCLPRWTSRPSWCVCVVYSYESVRNM